MKKLNILKISVDILMIIVFCLLFKNIGAGERFHEILGIIVAILLGTHIALNWNLIKEVGKKLFVKNFSSKSKFEFIINILMTISIIVALITGIFISKSLFSFLRLGNTTFLTKIHISSSFIALAFIGIHLGLRWRVISTKTKNALKITEIKREYIYVSRVLIGFILVFGIYSFYAQNYFPKVLMLETPKNEVKFDGNNKNFKNFKTPNNDDSKEFRNKDFKNNQNKNNSPSFKNGEEKNFKNKQNGHSEKGNSKISRDRQNAEGKYMGMKNGRGHTGRSNSILNILGITSAFAIVTVFIENLIRKRKAKKQI
ncbi:protein of unknown function [Clostridium cavendishii DSM 21758]|uniref:Flavinylation-associated cytochrome domain-containing protein n=1 Tax=Clostridium cavendishii DSM 21758 TaxID=1121302 RepID=A0A1M6IV63_9CLOT|nr:DUF4405 domain-containing protein [Clostridium cavendishii]SHJ38355.1 protein of unknown function [Clostridium cavendishii DSM 21758]